VSKKTSGNAELPVPFEYFTTMKFEGARAQNFVEQFFFFLAVVFLE
jgi:hypothetical protein